MKRLLSTALAIVLFISAAQAQEEGRGHHGKKGGDIYKELNLSEDQKTKLKTIREAEHTELKALKADGKTDTDRQARKSIHDKYKTQIDAVLTAEQKAQLEKKRSEMKEKMKDRGGKAGRLSGQDGGMGRQAAFMKKELNLSADQETKLKGIFQEYQTKAQEVRNNSGLSADQKREQVRSLGKQYMDKGKTVLTADQLKKLEEMKPKHNKRGAQNV